MKDKNNSGKDISVWLLSTLLSCKYEEPSVNLFKHTPG